jgi:hypothetical protein
MKLLVPLKAGGIYWVLSHYQLFQKDSVPCTLLIFENKETNSKSMNIKFNTILNVQNNLLGTLALAFHLTLKGNISTFLQSSLPRLQQRRKQTKWKYILLLKKHSQGWRVERVKGGGRMERTDWGPRRSIKDAEVWGRTVCLQSFVPNLYICVMCVISSLWMSVLLW